MAPSFKSPTGLPLAIYIEPSSKNRAASNKAILSNGGAPCPRLSNANVILIDATSHAGRECARQMCADPTKVVLFHEWIEACLSAGKLLGEDLNWGNLRIEDPEMVDESLFVDDDVPVVESKARVKEEEVHAVAERNDRPWPTPTSPTRLPPGELPVYAGEPSGSSRTPPPVKPEIQEPIPGPSHYDPRPSPPRHSRPSNTQTLTPPPQSYGRAAISPTLGNLFRAACEEYEILKKDPETYVFSGLKRKARSIERNSHSVDKPLKSPRVEAPRSSHSSHPGVYEPLAKKLRPPLPAGSTKRGPKRRSDESRTNQFSATPSQPFEIIDLLGSSLSPPPPLPNEKIFTLVGEPVQFWLQVDLPDRGSVIRLLRKHGGLMAPTMEAASYVIVSKAAPQYAEVLIEADTANRVAVPVAWINQCVKSGMMVPVDDYAIPASSIPLNSTLTQEDIIRAAMDDNPPQPSSPYSTAGASGKHAFTSEDLIFMQQYVAWKYARDPSFTTQSVCRELGLVAPHHTIRSWLWFYQRPSNEISRVVTTVKGLLA